MVKEKDIMLLSSSSNGKQWFEDAISAGLREPDAMVLSAAGKIGKP